MGPAGTEYGHDPANRDRRLLPLRLDDCQIPAKLRRLKYIDWRAESNSAWQELLATLQPGAVPLPEVPRDEWNPFDPYTPALESSFVGRTDELRRMQQAMETGHSVSVVGDWRIGKTSLLAERARAAERVVRQLSGEGPEGGSVSKFVTQVTGREILEKRTLLVNTLRLATGAATTSWAP